jgi:hypothetical protein
MQFRPLALASCVLAALMPAASLFAHEAPGGWTYHAVGKTP